MRYFYFNPPVSVKVCESSKIIWIPRTSMQISNSDTGNHSSYRKRALPI